MITKPSYVLLRKAQQNLYSVISRCPFKKNLEVVFDKVFFGKMEKYRGCVGVVTGASGGMGKAMALRLASNGIKGSN